MWKQIVDQPMNKTLFQNVESAPLRKKIGSWKCKLSEVLLDEFRILPLTSAKMLRSEGYWMNNCAKNYIDSCIEGEYIVFSIRNWLGDRVATLGVVNNSGYWQFDQCYGPGNTDVLYENREYQDEDGLIQYEPECSELYYIVHEVVRLLNEASACDVEGKGASVH